MVDITQHITDNATIREVDRVLEARFVAEWKPRDYVGFSGIGHECERKIWLDFHFPDNPAIGALGLRAIEDGFHCEDQMAARLRMVEGIELHTEMPQGHPRAGKQIRCEDFGGKFAGHLDGMIKGIKEAPETWHVWEHKAVNLEKFEKLDFFKNTSGSKKALELWDYVYYCQAVLYMHYQNVTRHFITVDAPGGRKTTSCRTDANPKLAKALRMKAQRIIETKKMPTALSNTPKHPTCMWCTYKDRCHPGKA